MVGISEALWLTISLGPHQCVFREISANKWGDNPHVSFPETRYRAYQQLGADYPNNYWAIGGWSTGATCPHPALPVAPPHNQGHLTFSDWVQITVFGVPGIR